MPRLSARIVLVTTDMQPTDDQGTRYELTGVQVDSFVVNGAAINITIVDEVPTIAYSPNDLDLTNNTASSDLPLSPTVTGSGEIVSWAISPSVPSGLAAFRLP